MEDPFAMVIHAASEPLVERFVILTTHSYFLNHDAKQVARMTPYSPLSTLIATALLRERGHRVAHFDSTFADGIDAFESALDLHRPSVVAVMEDNFNFLTKMCTVRRRQDAVAMIAAAVKRGCRVLVNGPDSTDRPELYLGAGAEAVLTGEGEATLCDAADVWRSDPCAPLDSVRGLVLRGPGSGVRRTPARPALRALDRLPFPAWDHVDADAYRRAWRSKHNRFSWNIATSRGCPYGCNWCAKPTFGRGYEQRSPASVATEMRLLKNAFAPDHFWFADDIFGLTVEWLRKFAAEVMRLDVRTPFTTQSRVNLMRPDAVQALADAGAEEVWLGVESGSQKILDGMEKGARVDEAREATRNLKAHGIRACWFIQLGYPGEDWDDLDRTRSLIREESPEDIGVSVAYPLPGTRFHELVKAEMGERRNWDDTGDLAMLFEGTYDTTFYRKIRAALHDEVRTRRFDDRRWARLGRDQERHRSPNPVALAS
jgi:anaerobic magnesium-protoporphyrin IX monomethyl ester cyclase